LLHYQKVGFKYLITKLLTYTLIFSLIKNMITFLLRGNNSIITNVVNYTKNKMDITANRWILYPLLFIYWVFYIEDNLIPRKYKWKHNYVPKSKRFRIGNKILLNIKRLTKKLDKTISNWTITKRKTKQTTNLSSNRLNYSTKYRRRRQKVTTITAMSLLAMATQTGKPLPRHFKVDTDSNTIGVDNRCSACISDRLEDFLYPPQPCQRTIKGFGGAKTTNVMIGTILWEWPDNTGKIHRFQIPKSYYVPHGKC
jgi:hypothetical protein